MKLLNIRLIKGLRFKIPRLVTLKSSLKAITNNKFRIFLSSFGVMIGICSVFIMLSVGEGIKRTITMSMGELGTNVLYMQASSEIFNSTDIDYLTKNKAIFDIDQIGISEMLNPTSVSIVGLSGSEEKIRNAGGSVSAIDANFTNVTGYEQLQGSPLNEFYISRKINVAVIGSLTAAKVFGLKSPIGYTLEIDKKYYQIIGVMKVKGSDPNAYSNGFAFIPLTINNIENPDIRYNVAFSPIGTTNLDTIQADITSLIYARHKNNYNGFTPYFMNPKQYTDFVLYFDIAFTLFILLIGGIALFISGLGIMNTMLASIGERTNEIGLRKALGATDKRILMQMLLESTIIVTFGSYFGTFLAMTIIYTANVLVQTQFRDFWLNSLNSFLLIVDFRVLLTIVFITAVVGVLAGIYPAVKASKLSPIEALKSN